MIDDETKFRYLAACDDLKAKIEGGFVGTFIVMGIGAGEMEDRTFFAMCYRDQDDRKRLLNFLAAQRDGDFDG